MGFFSFVSDAVSDVADAVGDTVADVAETVGDAALEVTTFIGQAAGEVGTIVGDVATVVDDISGGAFSTILNGLDDTVFDTVDYLSGGIIDVDFDDGNFSANVGIEGIASFGGSIGESGITFGGSTLLGGSEFSATDDGFGISGSAGINLPGLPYVEGHTEFGPNGEISVGGEVQGTIPTPAGLVSGEVSGGFVRNADGSFAADASLEGMLTTAGGVQVGGGVHGGVAVEADGDTSFNVGGDAFVGLVGVGRVGVGVEHTHIEQDGNTFTQTSAQGQASGFGMSASAGVSHTELETADGRQFSDTTASADLKGLDADSIMQLGSTLLGAAGVDIPVDADGLVGALGAGGVGDLFGSLTEGGQLESFIGGLSSDGLGSLLGNAAEGGMLGDLLGSLGSDAAAGLITRLVTGGGTPAPGGSPAPTTVAADDDVLGASAAGAAPLPSFELSDAASGDPSSMSVGFDEQAATFDPVFEASTDPVFDAAAPAAVITSAPDVEPFVEVAPEPVEEFDVAIEAADTVSTQSDALFDDL
jgi:hypothetical protein